MTDDRPIFLVGFMGCGKSELGRALSRELGWGFVDTDALVASREGRSVEQIFRQDGEPHFRRLETEALHGLDGSSRVVVATGGGLYDSAAHRRWIRRRGLAVWLDAPLAVCLKRLGRGADRPLWDPSNPTAFRAFYDRRAASYALADLHFPAVEGDADELVGRLLGVFD